MKPGSVVVKYRTVSITLFPWSPRPGANYWKFSANGKPVVRSTFEKAKEAALSVAKETYLGVAKLEGLSDQQTRNIRRMIEADASMSSVEEFLAWRKRFRVDISCKDAVAEFLQAKQGASGPSKRNVSTLKSHLAALPDMPLGDIRVCNLPPLKGAARSRDNRRRAWVTFFRWCRDCREYLPYGDKTAAERLERPRVVKGVPTTLSPENLRVLLDNVSPEYLGWLAASAFSGIRNAELSPVDSSKSPLDWSDFKWDRKIIIVRPETSKTGKRRVVPIMPALEAWLRPIAKKSGMVCPKRNPTKRKPRKQDAETVKLGKLIGGWKENALRHSFISFRAAQVGLAQAAMEAGNSESESKASYNDAKGADEAAEWFGVMPGESRQLRVV